MARWAATRAAREFARLWVGSLTVAEVVELLKAKRPLPWIPEGLVVPESQRDLRPPVSTGPKITAAEHREERAQKLVTPEDYFAQPAAIPVRHEQRPRVHDRERLLAIGVLGAHRRRVAVGPERAQQGVPVHRNRERRPQAPGTGMVLSPRATRVRRHKQRAALRGQRHRRFAAIDQRQGALDARDEGRGRKTAR